jgi:hypothetical protein
VRGKINTKTRCPQLSENLVEKMAGKEEKMETEQPEEGKVQKKWVACDSSSH